VRYQSTLALMLLCAAFTLASAPAAFAQNEIAYRCDLDICLLDPANPGAVTNLTDNGETSYDQRPIWSPDGTKVAFVSDFTSKEGHGAWNVFVMPAAGTGDEINLATQITSYAKTESRVIEDLAWSPDGSRIAYTRGNNSGEDKVWVENADGTSVFPLEIGGGGAKRHPSWSPDSSKIAYAVVKNGPEQIYIASSLGGIGQPLANGVGHEPNWSPNGAKIAFDAYKSPSSSYVDLHVVTPDGSGSPLIVPPSPYTQWTFNAWAPDGGRIAYRATEGSGATVYRVMNADGGGDHPLASPGEGDAREASWSPDGSRIVYEHTPFPNTGASDLYLVNADGSGGAQPLTSDGKSFDPAWRVVIAASPGQPPGPGQTPQVPPPHPGAKKPKVVWITKRIFVGGGRPVPMMNVFCGAPDCGANSHATGKVSRAAGLSFRPALARAGKKAKQILVGKGKLHLTEGQTKTLYLHLNRAGRTLLEKQGKLTIHATVTIKSTGLASETFKKTLHLVFKKTKKKR
jgi:Tol biopolymer transport system component